MSTDKLVVNPISIQVIDTFCVIIIHWQFPILLGTGQIIASRKLSHATWKHCKMWHPALVDGIAQRDPTSKELTHDDFAPKKARDLNW